MSNIAFQAVKGKLYGVWDPFFADYMAPANLKMRSDASLEAGMARHLFFGVNYELWKMSALLSTK